MRYLYRRGPGATRRVMHLTLHNTVTGEPLMYPLCATPGPYNTTVNVTLSQRVCKRCTKLASTRRYPAGLG